MSSKRRIVAWAFAIGAVAGFMSNVVAGYVAPAFEGRRWLAVGLFVVSLLIGLWLALRQREEQQPRTVQLPTPQMLPEQQSSNHPVVEPRMVLSPYIVGHPVDPDNFFGRREQVERFFGVIGGEQIQSVSLLGLRRSGKTSFLRYVAHPPVMGYYLSDPSEYLLVFVNLQSGVATPADFYYKVTAALAAAAGISSPLSRFDQPQLRHIQAMLDTVAPHRVAILLDELDRLTAYPVFDEVFFTGLRSLVSDYKLAWVTTSYRNLYELGRQLNVPQTSPFFNIFSTSIYLGALTPSEADELIIEPALSARQPFSTDDVVWLKTLASQIPAFLQKAAQVLFEARHLHPAGSTARQEARQEFTRWAVHHFTYYWENFTDIERDILARIAAGDTSIDSFASGHHQDDTVVDDLASYGLVAKSEDRYCISGTALADWIRRQVSSPLAVERPKSASAAAQPVPPSVSVSLLTHVVPTAYCYHLDATAFPQVIVNFDNTDQGCTNATLYITSIIEGYSDAAIDGLSVPQGEQARIALLPLLKPAAVATLNDIRPATLHVTVEQTTPIARTLYDQTQRIHLHARDTALVAVKAPDGSIVDLTDYLVAWVTPRRPEIERLLRQAAEHHPDRQFLGYQGAATLADAAAIVREQARAIFTALKRDTGLVYINSPLTLGVQADQIAQRVRLPTESLAAGGSANCIDGTVLFASLLELASIEPLIVLVPGHAFVGWRIWPETDQCEFLETTLISSASFDTAQQAAQAQYENALLKGHFKRGLFDPTGFALLIDVTACRVKGIYPLE